VGKSTLFNRLIRANKALTHDTPGVTRDRIYGEVKGDPPFALVDTGGLVLEGEGVEAEIMRQAEEAIRDSHVILFVVDAKQGLTALDEQTADYLRRSDRPILLAANKVDGYEQESLAAEFHALGFDVHSVSGAHGYNTAELAERLREMVEESGAAAEAGRRRPPGRPASPRPGSRP
jgi:GTP-binding protein